MFTFFALPALFVATLALADVAVPPLKARVTDLTGTLSAQQLATIEQNLAAFEKRKGSQIAVLIVPTTQPEAVEQYAVRVEEQWKLGRKGTDDGVLLLIAKDDRRLRIEVGYGLEGVLPDSIAKRIIEDDITPRFKQGDFYGGISAGVDRLIRKIDGEPLPRSQSKPEPRSQQHDPATLRWFFVIELILVPLAYGALRLSRERLGSYWWGAIAAGVSGLMAWMLAGQAELFAFGAVFAFVGAAVLLFLSPPDLSPSTFTVVDGRMRGIGGFGGKVRSKELSTWSWEKGDSGSSSSDSGGFSGGGGGSGGGGASGSW